MRVSVFVFDANPAIDRPFVRKSLKWCEGEVLYGRARLNVAGDITKGIQMFGRIPKRRPALSSKQGEVYERYGAEKYRQVVQGGLTRTETKPSAKPSILNWGHIGEKPTPQPRKHLRDSSES